MAFTKRFVVFDTSGMSVGDFFRPLTYSRLRAMINLAATVTSLQHGLFLLMSPHEHGYHEWSGAGGYMHLSVHLAFTMVVLTVASVVCPKET